MRPCFALVDVELDDKLEPVTAFLARNQVPFAILAMGPEARVLDRSEALRDRPRIQRPFHGPTLQATAGSLCRQGLCSALENADRNLAEGRLRLARQVKLVERMAAAGQDTTAVEALAREYGRLLKTMRTSRRLLAQRMDDMAERLMQAEVAEG
jgi:hypothetical protein